MERLADKNFRSQLIKHWRKAIVVLLIILFFLGYSRLFSNSKDKPSIVTVAQPLAEVEVGKTFEFPAQVIEKEGKRRREETLKFTIVKAEIKEEIKVKGKPRPASQGKAYLLLRLELNNETTERLAFASADYIRRVDEEGKLFAPDFHNGLVGIEPLSIKRDLTSFIVDKDQKNFTFQVGELKGEKEKIEIHF